MKDELINNNSTLRELVGLHEALKKLTPILRGKTVEVRMDSEPAICNLIKGGGPKPHLTQIVKAVHEWKDENKVSLTYKWIPREQNKVADALSRPAPTVWKLRANGVADRAITWGHPFTMENRSHLTTHEFFSRTLTLST